MNMNIIVYIALISTVIIWGFSFIGSKIAMTSISPFPYLFFRFSIAALFFVVLFLFRGFPSISLKDHSKIFLLSFFEPGLYFIFETLGLSYNTSASKTAIIIGMIPIAVLIFARLILKERITGNKIMGILLSVLGITLLVIEGSNFSSEGALTGDFLVFGAVITAALYIVITRSVGKKVSAIEITGLQIIYGSIFFTPFFLYELPDINWVQITNQSVISVVVLALFATIGAFLLYNYALTRIQATRAAIYLNGIPIVTLIFAGPILNEELTILQLLGAAIVLFAVYITNMQPKKGRTFSQIETLSTEQTY